MSHVSVSLSTQHSALSIQSLGASVISNWQLAITNLATRLKPQRRHSMNSDALCLLFHDASNSMAAVRVERRTHRVFLFLMLAQAAHSTEEYVAKLYEVFTPARLVSSLLSDNLAFGFLVANAALVAFGLWCWAFPVRLGWNAAGALTWFWALLELGNGVGHTGLAIAREGYFPGVLTAPLLLLFAGWLLWEARSGNGYTVSKRVVER